MKNYLKLNLSIFDGAAGAAGAGIGGTPAVAATGEKGSGAGVIGQDAAGQAEETESLYEEIPPEGTDPDNHLASGEVKIKTEEERAAEFENLIKNEYKDEFSKRVQSVVKRRLGDVKKLEDENKEAGELLSLIGMKYGVDAKNAKALREAIENDETYWEEAAEKEGITVEQYKKFKKMEAENAALKHAEEEAKRNFQRDAIFEKWNQEAEQLKNFYPNFDLAKESQNEQFMRLLGAGIDMKTTFETIHHEELLTGAMSYTAKRIAKKQADAIRSGMMRPAENGISSRAAAVVKKDPNRLTHDDILDIKRRVQNGEIVTF